MKLTHVSSIASCLILASCFSPKSEGVTATHNLVPHVQASSVGSSGGTAYATCWAYYTSDSSSSPVSFETNAVVTCGNQGNVQALILQSDDSTWIGTVPYAPGLPLVVTVVRPADGSSLATAVTVH